jgi:hypothetical protein
MIYLIKTACLEDFCWMRNIYLIKQLQILKRERYMFSPFIILYAQYLTYHQLVLYVTVIQIVEYVLKGLHQDLWTQNIFHFQCSKLIMYPIFI